MQFQVPQFIETEDTIIGSITIKQFVILCAAGVIVFLLYFAVQTWLWVLFAIIIGGGTAVLTLVKVNSQPLAKIAWSAFLFYWNAQRYTWQPSGQEQEKNTAALENIGSSGFGLEKILYSAALKSAWGALQTGATKKKEQAPKEPPQRYEIIRKKTGEHEAVRRVDFT